MVMIIVMMKVLGIIDDGEGGDEIDDVQGRLPLSLGRTIKSCSLPLLAGSGWGGGLSISAWQCNLMDDDDID